MIINPYNVQPAGGNRTLFQIITDLGIGTSLRLALDAGDSASFTSGQKWLDTSGNGDDFFHGADVNVAADDPTFNGTPGGLSSAEYWGHDGGDFFTHDAANPTWVENLHKGNAPYTIVFVIYVGSLAATQRIFSTISNFGTDTGWIATLNTDGTFLVIVKNAGSTVLQFGGSGITAGAWHFIAWSCDPAIGAGGALSVLNGVVVNTASSTYTSPSAGAATGTLHIGSSSTGTNLLSSGSREGIVAAWSRALAAPEMGNLHAVLRGRFPW